MKTKFKIGDTIIWKQNEYKGVEAKILDIDPKSKTYHYHFTKHIESKIGGKAMYWTISGLEDECDLKPIDCNRFWTKFNEGTL